MAAIGPTFFLASASPRRAELLRQIGLNFRVLPTDVEEQTIPEATPHETALYNARAKAHSAAVKAIMDPNVYIIAADTIVVIEDRILGKPKDREEATGMLRSLRGRSHTVITAVAIICPSLQRAVEGCSTTVVTMTNFRDDELAAYVESAEPMDKAGAYGIQGKAGLFVESIEGSYSNVVGLPLELLRVLCFELGIVNLLEPQFHV